MKDARIKGDNTSKVIRATAPDTYEQFRQALANGTLLADILTNYAGYEEPGTALSKQNLLTDETAEALGFNPENNPTPETVFAMLANGLARTASRAFSNSGYTYAKISGFGAWGSGAWYEKGFSMLITSRAGELIWLSVSSDDSNTNARAIRFMNTYSKMIAVYYSASESAIYVRLNAWSNNINAHIVTNINGDYVPVIEEASGVPSDAVEVDIVEFGAGYDSTNIGNSKRALAAVGSGDRPTYNGKEVALKEDAEARAPAYEYGTADLIAGSSPLETGKLYLVYE